MVNAIYVTNDAYDGILLNNGTKGGRNARV